MSPATPFASLLVHLFDSLRLIRPLFELYFTLTPSHSLVRSVSFVCCLSMQILEDLIKFRWKSLAAPTREGVRTYLVQKIIGVSEGMMEAQRMQRLRELA